MRLSSMVHSPVSLRRRGVSAAGDRAAGRAGLRLHRRGVRADRAAAAPAVAHRGGTPRPWRCGGLPGASPPGGRLAWLLPREPSPRSEEHTSELQSLMRISYAVFCFKNKIYTHI